MTQEELEKRDALRLMLLRTIYDVTGGSTRKSVDPGLLADNLHVGRESALEEMRHLAGIGLLELYNQGSVYLTRRGVLEAESTVRAPDRPTDHFSVPVIHLTINGPVGVGVQTGGTSAVNQKLGVPSEDLLRLLSEIGAGLPSGHVALEVVEALREELAKEPPRSSRLKSLGSALWKMTEGIVVIAPKVVELLKAFGAPI